MSGTEQNEVDESQKDIVDANADNRAELDAAQINLQAERSDLEHLLAYIKQHPVSRKQTPGLLKQAYMRLVSLRTSQPELAKLFVKEPDVAGLVEQASSALQSGDAFSLDDCWQACEQASAVYSANEHQAELLALLRSRQAEVAALKQNFKQAADLFAAAAATPQLTAPMQWQYQNKCALLLETLGRETGDVAALGQAIDLYQSAIVALEQDKGRRDDWATTQNNLGSALGVLGQRQRGTIMLEKSIEAFERALSERDRGRVPLDWAVTQNNLGNTLGILGQRQADMAMLAKSVEAFECALEERAQERVPHDWATTQSNLGAVLHALGQQKKDTQLLKKAVDAYKNVMQEWTRERVPLDWATTMNNLATALRLLGEQRKGERTLEQSVAAYRNALSERTRERVPMDWAMTQNNLGAALQTLGERTDNIQMLEESVTAYENALQEWTYERMPIGWAMTKANVGVAQRTLAERSRDIGISRKAVANVSAAVKIFRDASHAQYTELGEEQLVKARAVEEVLAQE
ncbi:MAG: tetratricopeptide repeat protein [Granulosicoccus sp.]